MKGFKSHLNPFLCNCGQELKRMELLAPAGTWENFLAALESGADAIYLGGKAFNARSHAANFSHEELAAAVKLAHLVGADVYVTVNILISDAEMKALAEYLKELDDMGVDAIIVQDLAVAALARKVAPRLHLHGSTQMTATNLGTVRFLERLGFTRVVLARELSLEEITAICKDAEAEIEVFIHGALCVCYSGQCLMSSFIGGRSGNRGSCAQPCRLPYELLGEDGRVINAPEEGYIMSPKDLNYSAHMKELMAAGVASFKVEGRMKKETYVRQIIGTYRHIIDNAGQVTEDDASRLAEGFNRGFSTAYLENTTGRAMMTVTAPNNRGKEIGTAELRKGRWQLTVSEEVRDGDLLKVHGASGHIGYVTVDAAWPAPQEKERSGRKYYVYTGVRCEDMQAGVVFLAAKAGGGTKRRGLQEFTRKHRVYAYLDGQEGQSPSLTLVMEDGEAVTVSDASYCVQRARKAPTPFEAVYKQLNRLGNTVFLLAELAIPEAPFMWPASVLNELRRQAIKALEERILARHEARRQALQRMPRDGDTYTFKKLGAENKTTPRITAHTDEWEQVKAAIAAGADTIVFGGDRLQRRPYDVDVYAEVSRYCQDAGVPLVLATPRVIRQGEEEAYKKTLAAMIAAAPQAIGIHFPGALEWLAELGYTGPVIGESSLQICNATAASVWAGYGLSGLVASQEATLHQITKLAAQSPIPVECIVHGRTELMISEYCAIASFAGTGCKRNCPAPCLKEHFALRDRTGATFPLYTDPYCRMHIMNSRELDMRAYVPELMRKPIGALRIDCRQRGAAWTEQTVREYKAIMSGRQAAPKKESGERITRGHYFKGIF